MLIGNPDISRVTEFYKAAFLSKNLELPMVIRKTEDPPVEIFKRESNFFVNENRQSKAPGCPGAFNLRVKKRRNKKALANKLKKKQRKRNK